MSRREGCNISFKKETTCGVTKTKKRAKNDGKFQTAICFSGVFGKSTLAKRLRGVSSYCRMTAKPMLKEDLSQAFLAVRESSKLIMWRVAFSM